MGWTPQQQERLDQERLILSHYFPALCWFLPEQPGRAYLEGTFVTNSARRYVLRIYLPVDYPDGSPDLVVCDPFPLRDHQGRFLSVEDPAMHTLGMRDGRPKICHFRRDEWVPNHTLYLVARRGQLWLAAYEGHLRTGKPIDRFMPCESR